MPTAVPPQNLEAELGDPRERTTALLTLRVAIASVCLVSVALGVFLFPVLPWLLGSALSAYGVLLWYRPAAFLLVLPVVLPAWDMGIWSGWILIGESDFFVLTTLAVLIIRTPLRLADLLPTGLARVVLLVFTASWAIATVVGVASPLGAPYSDNAFLRPDNALRLAKGFVEALVLLPFLRQRERSHNDAISLLGYGFSIGIAVVAVIVRSERALFTPFLDFSAAYRVVGPFSSMRTGGGHIGAYAVLALPMALCLPRLRPRWLGMILLLVTSSLSIYIIAVSFARTAYAAGALAMSVAGLGWLWASWRQRRPFTLGLIPVLLVLMGIVTAALYGGMRERLVVATQDFLTHRANWWAGLAIRDTGVLSDVFGMGLGTYQRAMLMRSAVDRPTDFVIKRDGQNTQSGMENGAYVSMRVETQFFFGQKISLPSAGDLHLTLRARVADTPKTSDHVALQVLVCDKVLLYSEQCRGQATELTILGTWQTVAMTLPVAGLGRVSPLGWFTRPVELSLSGPIGHRIEIGEVRLFDDIRHPLLKNGDFSQGLDYWGFTDDTHVAWRMFDQYLMLWFETGALGVAAFLALGGLSIVGGMRATWHGAVTGAAVAASILGFLLSCLFDNLLEAPRLATLFFLVCLSGLVQFENRRRRPRLSGSR